MRILLWCPDCPGVPQGKPTPFSVAESTEIDVTTSGATSLRCDVCGAQLLTPLVEGKLMGLDPVRP